MSNKTIASDKAYISENVAPKMEILPVGLAIMMTPIKPTIMIPSLERERGSLRKIAARTVIKKIEEKESAVASAKGKYLKDIKRQKRSMIKMADANKYIP